MVQEALPGSEPRIELPEKILRLHEVLESSDIPHAFGGALAVDYYGIPRATIDIDIDIFLQPKEKAKVLAALNDAFEIPDTDAFKKEVEDREQGLTHWGNTRIDIFFSVGEFHESVAERIQHVSFNGAEIPILSAEDILIFKALYNRGKDWVDIETVCDVSKASTRVLDKDYMKGWLSEIIGSDDPRVARLLAAVDENDGQANS